MDPSFLPEASGQGKKKPKEKKEKAPKEAKPKLIKMTKPPKPAKALRSETRRELLQPAVADDAKERRRSSIQSMREHAQSRDASAAASPCTAACTTDTAVFSLRRRLAQQANPVRNSSTVQPPVTRHVKSHVLMESSHIASGPQPAKSPNKPGLHHV